MLTLEPFSEDQGRSAVHPARGIPPISFLAPCGFTHPLTRTHVRLLGPCFKTGRMGCPQAGAGSTQVYRRDGAVLPTTIDATASPRAYRQLGLWPPAPIRTGPRPESIGGPAIAVPHPTGTQSPAPIRFPSRQFQALFDSLFKVLFIFPSRGLGARSAAEDASPDYNSDSEAVRFSSWADPRFASPLLRESLVRQMNPSAGSPTETLLRLLLPLNDKVQWNSRDVAGGEPPTSPAILTLHRTIQSVGATGAGITAAAGTRLALQWILVKGFRLYSFQLPDSFEPRYCYLLSLTSPCQDWVICAPAAFLGCGSRFSGSLSGIEP
ncbi:hypothetical protein L1887_46024 [Cichorium endivia]|nr:hypothetical protein L1887_46024 [Cichorium endivia]